MSPRSKRYPTTAICIRVVKILEASKRSRSDLARHLGEIPESFNKKLLHGTIRAETTPALADELGVSLQYLLTGLDEEVQILVSLLTPVLKELTKLEKRHKLQIRASAIPTR